MKKASDGSFLDIKTYTEAYIENVPYIQLYFTGVTNDGILIKTFPLQYLIEEGDKLVLAVSGGPDSIAMLNSLYKPF